jgi:hypothetical protein
MKGFVAAFYIDNPFYDSTTLPHPKKADCSGCTSSLCTDAAVTECIDDWGIGSFGDQLGDDCDDTDCTQANKSCVRALSCNATACDGVDNCHLCADAECPKCLSYAEGDCKVNGTTTSCSSNTTT